MSLAHSANLAGSQETSSKVGALVKNTHWLIVGTACMVALLAILYVMLYGLIHDGQSGKEILAWFQNLLYIVFPAGTLSTAISQVIDYLKSKGASGNALPSATQQQPVGPA